MADLGRFIIAIGPQYYQAEEGGHVFTTTDPRIAATYSIADDAAWDAIRLARGLGKQTRVADRNSETS